MPKAKRTRKNKYGVSDPGERRFNGRTYHSKTEMLYARELFHMRQADLIQDFVEQPQVALGIPENKYRPDFLVIQAEGQAFYVEISGYITAQKRRNLKLWASYGWLDLCVVKRIGDKFVTTEVVHGQNSLS